MKFHVRFFPAYPAHSGMAQLGIEALELKTRGFSGADIARLCHPEPNYVGAWISRAAKKLRAGAAFCGHFGKAVEKGRADS